MGFRDNQPTTGRDFFFSTSGDNAFLGTSDENPVADPSQAATNASALTPPPGTSDPASINASVSGTYSAGVVVPQFVTCRASSASVITSDAINVQAMGRHEVEWGSLLNFSNNGICFQIDGQTRVAAEVNACVPVGEDGIGFNITGVCDEVFVELRLGDIQGERGIMFNHTANSPTPIQYRVENVTFNTDDQTAILYNDTVGTTATVFNVSDVQTKNGGAVAPGSIVAHIMAGTAVVDSDVLAAETIARVEGGGILTLSAQNIFGNTLIESGGICIYPSMAFCSGDLETQSAAALQTRITNIVGDITNAGSMSILSDSVTGEIINTGSMFVIIGTYSGTMPDDDGSIDGIINDVRFGNWVPESDKTILDFSPGTSTTSGSVPLAKATVVIPDVDATFIIEGTSMTSFSNVNGHSVVRLFNDTDLSALGRQWEVEQEDADDILSPVLRQEFVQTEGSGAKTIELQFFVGSGTGTISISDALLTANEVIDV